MTGKQLRAIRDRMELSQAELAKRLKITASSVARMEQGVMIVTPPMELLISYVAREHLGESAYPKRGGGRAQGKRAHAKAAKTPPRQARKAV